MMDNIMDEFQWEEFMKKADQRTDNIAPMYQIAYQFPLRALQYRQRKLLEVLALDLRRKDLEATSLTVSADWRWLTAT